MRTALDAGECGDCAVADDVLAVPRRALRRGRPHRAERARARVLDRRADRQAGRAGRRRGRDAAQGRPLRQGRRPALRLHLGLDQVHARVGPRRLALLPRGDARGRRGPALHRAPDGHPRLRGHRQRRPPGAAGGGRRGRRGRARRAARGPVRARPGGDLPLAGAEVQRRHARASAPRGPTSATTARSCRPRRCARRPTRRRPSSAAGSATTTRTTTRARSTTRTTCPTGSRTCASTTRATWSRSCASAWSRSAAPAACDLAHARLDLKFIRARCHGRGHGSLRHLTAAAHVPGPGRAARAPAHGRARPTARWWPRCSSAAACRPTTSTCGGCWPSTPRGGTCCARWRRSTAPRCSPGWARSTSARTSPDLLVVDERFGPALAELLGRVLIERSRSRRAA